MAKPERRNKEGNKRVRYERPDAASLLENWKPKTRLGKQVKEGLITDIDQIFEKGEKIFEIEIVDTLLPNLESDLLLIGQAKGKFGGGQRRIFRQTQKKTREGNKIHFTTCGLVGNKNSYIGIGFGKSKETVPARDSSIRKAKLNILKIRRGCGCWECNCGEPHSIPFVIEGKCGSAQIKLMPAPKGKGLCIEKECAKILRMAGVKDIWSKTKGQTKTKINLIKALIKALENLTELKVQESHKQKLGLIEGKIKPNEGPLEEDYAEIILETEAKPEEQVKEEKKKNKKTELKQKTESPKE